MPPRPLDVAGEEQGPRHRALNERQLFLKGRVFRIPRGNAPGDLEIFAIMLERPRRVAAQPENVADVAVGEAQEAQPLEIVGRRPHQGSQRAGGLAGSRKSEE